MVENLVQAAGIVDEGDDPHLGVTDLATQGAKLHHRCAPATWPTDTRPSC